MTVFHRFISVVSLFVGVLFLLVGCFHEDEEDREVVRVGEDVPRFVVALSDGTTYDSSVRDGKGATIVFFATWCTDCQRELPVLDSLYRAGRFAGQHVVCIGREEDEATVSQFWQEHALALPYSAQPDRAVFSLFATTGIPRIYTVSPSGVITNISFTLEP